MQRVHIQKNIAAVLLGASAPWVFSQEVAKTSLLVHIKNDVTASADSGGNSIAPGGTITSGAAEASVFIRTITGGSDATSTEVYISAQGEGVRVEKETSGQGVISNIRVEAISRATSSISTSTEQKAFKPTKQIPPRNIAPPRLPELYLQTFPAGFAAEPALPAQLSAVYKIKQALLAYTKYVFSFFSRTR